MDIVARLQLEVEAMKFGPIGHSTLGRPTSPVRSKPVVFTSAKVPKFVGITSWEQNRQVFDTIAQSNGWDDATAALQFLSHLEGDALNMALLVPEVRRATQTGLVGALTEHYGSPGQFAEYRRQFEKTARKEGEEHWRRLGTLVILHDSVLYVTDLLLAMTVVLCADIWIVWHRRLPSKILLTFVECGRATPTQWLGGLVNRHPREPYRSILWMNRGVVWMTGWRRLGAFHRRCRNSWRLCSEGCFPPRWCRRCLPNRYIRNWIACYIVYWWECRQQSPLHHLGPELPTWKRCCRACFQGRRFQPDGRNWVSFVRTGLRCCVSVVAWRNMGWVSAPNWIRHFPLCCRDGRRRRWEAVMSWYHSEWLRNISGRKTGTDLRRGVSHPQGCLI